MAEITVLAVPAPPWPRIRTPGSLGKVPTAFVRAGDPTGASLAGEWELLDGRRRGVAVIISLMHPPVRPLPKQDPEMKIERDLRLAWPPEWAVVPALAVSWKVSK